MKVSLKWITPEADKMVAHMARVSNPNAKEGDPSTRLIRYLMAHHHWSPFEMACMCVEIETSRDIARQILRHRSFHFQEFSQRYAEVKEKPIFRETRLQDKTNRQNSIPTNVKETVEFWNDIQDLVSGTAHKFYELALQEGIAKEVARALLPEGMTPTRMYMQGTLRDWIHYLEIRCGIETQKEHREIAEAIKQILGRHCPDIYIAAFKPPQYDPV